MSDDYNEILDRSWDELPPVQLAPDGSYLLRGRNAAYIPGKDTSDKVLFSYNVKAPLEDVDPDELAELGDYDITQNRVTYTMWVEDGADWDAVRKHMALHGMDLSDYKSIRESIKAFRGFEIIAYLTANSYVVKSTGETKTENKPSKFAAVED